MNQDNKILRSDGRVEWICEHGVGHVVSVPSKYRNESSWWVHGCDGCCNEFNKKIVIFHNYIGINTKTGENVCCAFLDFNFDIMV